MDLDDRLRYRPEWRQVAPSAVVGCVIGLVVLASLARRHLPAGIVGLVAVIVLSGLASRYSTTTLTASGIVVRGLRMRRVPWQAIDEVTVVRAARSQRVMVSDAGGRRTLLPAPFTGPGAPDPAFEAKVQVIRTHLQRYRAVVERR